MLLVVVGLLTAAFAGGFVVSRATERGPAGRASQEIVDLLDANFAALNGGTSARLASTYTPDAVLTDLQTGERWSGVAEVVRYELRLARTTGMVVERTSDVVYVDGYASFTFRYGDGLQVKPGAAAFRIEDGKIAHEWVMSDEPGGWYLASRPRR